MCVLLCVCCVDVCCMMIVRQTRSGMGSEWATCGGYKRLGRIRVNRRLPVPPAEVFATVPSKVAPCCGQPIA